MIDPVLPVGDGRPELTDEDRDGLMPTYIATRGELYEAEQSNIAKALIRRKPRSDQILDDKNLRALHESMFGEVWKWAGKYRQRETNIGIAPTQIGVEMRKLVDDVKAWIEHETYELPEIVARFHHQLVKIHPFPNGNGRFGRVAAEMLATALGGEKPTWGSNLDIDTAGMRTRYLTALHAADDGDMGLLIDFAAS